MILEIGVLVVTALLTVIAVVGRTRSGTSETLGRPTAIGWAAIGLAGVLLLFSIRSAASSARDEADLRSALDRSIDQDLLLSLADEKSQRKLVFSVPLLASDPTARRDVRDVLYPGWRRETTGRALGELAMKLDSAHVKLQVRVDVGWDRVLPRQLSATEFQLVASRFFLPEQQRSCGVQRLWQALSEETRKELEEVRPRFLRGAGSRQSVLFELEEALSAVSYQRDFYKDPCFSELVVGLPRGVFERRIPLQDAAHLNRTVMRRVLGVVAPDLESFCNKDALLKSGGANAKFDPLQDGLGPSFDFTLDCHIDALASEEARLRLEFTFAGGASLTDWLVDFEVGKRVFEITYFEYNETSLDAETVIRAWGETFSPTPARVILPLNESGSVGVHYRAEYTGTVDSDGRPSLVWTVTSPYEVGLVGRHER